jgi:hypothetical protein
MPLPLFGLHRAREATFSYFGERGWGGSCSEFSSEFLELNLGIWAAALATSLGGSDSNALGFTASGPLQFTHRCRMRRAARARHVEIPLLDTRRTLPLR